MKTILTDTESHATTLSYDWGTLRWLAGETVQNAHHLSAAYVIIKAGCANPRHRHNQAEEALHLLTGTLHHTLGDEAMHLNAGDTIVIPAGVFHNARTIGDEDAHMIVMYSTPARDFELEEQSYE